MSWTSFFQSASKLAELGGKVVPGLGVASGALDWAAAQSGTKDATGKPVFDIIDFNTYFPGGSNYGKNYPVVRKVSKDEQLDWIRAYNSGTPEMAYQRADLFTKALANGTGDFDRAGAKINQSQANWDVFWSELHSKYYKVPGSQKTSSNQPVFGSTGNPFNKTLLGVPVWAILVCLFLFRKKLFR